MSDQASLAYDADFFVLRSAAVPIEEFTGWAQAVAAPSAPDEKLAGAIERDRVALHDRLVEFWSAPEMREALFLGSPTLEAKLDMWLSSEPSRRTEKAERALVRYFARMAGRAVPFGLFAGCTVGEIGAGTRLIVEPVEHALRRTRLDTGYVDLIAATLDEVHAVRERLRFHPNATLYEVAGQLRWIEVRRREQQRSHHLAAASESRFAAAVLSRAGAGATIDELVEALSVLGVERDRAALYVNQLIDGQILVSEMETVVTGQEPLDALIGTLQAAGITDYWPDLASVRDDLTALDAAAAPVPPARYRAIASKLEKLPAEPDPARLFQVDIGKRPRELTLGHEIITALVKCAETLARISRPEDELAAFRDAFVERYEQRLVPLLQALDNDLGIGFPGRRPSGGAAEPLLRGLPFRSGPERGVEWTARERFLVEKLLEAKAAAEREIILSKEDIERLELDERVPLPDAFAVMARVAAGSEAELDRGAFEVYVQRLEGPSGASLLGRFCYAIPGLSARVVSHVRAEQALDPDVIYAEIVHIPEGRHGNVICRPVLREWEIPFLGRSGAPRDRQLPLDDLLVGVDGQEVVLISRRLGHRVVPRLSSTHDFRRYGASLYRFLCLAQAPRGSGWGWHWGGLAQTSFLPRVRVGRSVLSLARWRVTQDEIRALQVRPADARFRAVQRLRDLRGLPRLLVLGDGDMTFPIDLDNVLSVEAMVASLADRKSATLTELWPGPERLVAREDHGHLVSELVVPFTRRKRVLPPRKASMREIELLERDARVLALDSEWLYVKLYTGETLADQVLRAVAPTALATGAVDRWFFVRYRDQGHHVRLRFHGEPGALRSVVLPAVEAAVKPLLARGTVLRISLDTYERELERYGGSRGIELAERIFHVDSEAVLELLSQLERGDRGAEERWQIALLGASTLLDDMRLGADAEIRLLERLREAFGAEFRADAALGRALSGRLRAHRSMLTALVEGRESDAAALAPGIRTLRRRSAALAPLLDELRALDTDRTLTKGIPELGESYVHMHLNRIFRSAQRAQELVIYDFLLRLRSSSRARSFGAAKDATLPGSKAGGGADRNRDAPDRRRA